MSNCDQCLKYAEDWDTCTVIGACFFTPKATKEEKAIEILLEEIHSRSFESDEMTIQEKNLWKSDKLACIYAVIKEEAQ